MPTDGKTLSLFGETAPSGLEAGKVHRDLSKLMREIAAARAAIVHNTSILDALKRKYQQDVLPLLDEIVASRRETFRILGAHLNAGWLKKRPAALLRQALTDLADDLEFEYGIEMDQDRVSILGEDSMSDEKAQTEEVSPRDREAAEKLQADFEAFLKEFHGASNEAESGFANQHAKAGRQGRKANPKSKAAQKQAVEAQALAGDVRALYLLLARALHPDKEPDPERRGAKTLWMQKVTDAYGSRDLARLLDILSQNPLEAVGPYLSTAPLSTVKGFIKRLRRELAALKREAARTFDPGLPDFVRAFLTPKGINEPAFQGHLAELKKELRTLKSRNAAYARKEIILELVQELRHQDSSFFM